MPPLRRHAENPPVLGKHADAYETPKFRGIKGTKFDKSKKTDTLMLKMFKKRLPKGKDFLNSQKD